MSNVLLLLSACRGPSLPEPALQAIVPDFAWNGEQETITLVGENFFPQLAIDARTGVAEINPSYRAFLVGPDGSTDRTELIGVGILDERHLAGTVDEGLDPGRYDVLVEGPTGLDAALVSAFRVTDEQAAQLTLSSPKVVYEVSEEAAITIELLDVGGALVDLPIEVAVSGLPGIAGTELMFEAGTLGSARPTPDGDGLLGTVTHGTATVFVRPRVPDRLTLTVAPWDPASSVVGDSMALTFEPGDDWSVVFELPASPLPGPTWAAGDAMAVVARVVDQYENPVDQPIPVTLRTSCSGWVGKAVLEGDTEIEVVPRLVTSAFCPEDRVEIVQPSSLAGGSEPFQVVAGPTEHFVVLASPPEVRAGDTVDVLVDPEDAFGNRSTFEGAVAISDSEGGLVGGSCDVFAATILCTGTVTRAAPAVTVTATGDDGTTGLSNPIEVQADDAPGALVVEATGPAVAGEPLPVWVHLLDAWGNEMDGATVPVGAVRLRDELSDVTCVQTGIGPSGAVGEACTFEVARTDATLTATLPAASLVAHATLDVQNGALAEVTFTGPSTAIAGTAIAGQVAGSDAFGNPYVVQSDPVVLLSDDSGTFSLPQVSLNASGTAAWLGSFTLAGTTHLAASQGGAEIGRSEPIIVGPAATVGLKVSPAEPWGWLGTPMDVQVESVDDYDNRTDETLVAVLASLDTGSPSVQVNLVNGVGVSPFSWTTAAWPDRLEATSDPWTGETTLLVARVCTPGPQAEVTFGGFDEAVACVDGTGTAPLVADLSGSRRGLSPLVAYAVSVDDGPAAGAGQPVVSTTLPSVGHHQVRALVVDNQGCGSETPADAWAGPDDGTPVGPIPLSTTAADLGVVDAIPLDISGVVDCARDPASFGVIEIRSTVGSLSAVTASGAGLQARLDVNGHAASTWSTAGGVSDTVASVVAWTDNGAASGVLELQVVGDNIRPVVLGSDPSGYGVGPVSTLTLRFSEPILAATAIPANFSVSGPTVVPVQAVTADVDEVTLTLSSPIERDLGVVYTVSVAAAVRDVAGNRLAGSWDVGPADWSGGVGGAEATLDAPLCGDAPSTFRPDGDDGPGEEADVFELGVAADVAPAWWVVQVRDTLDDLVFERWVVPLSADDVVVWAGRGFQGAVVEDGTYTVSVQPDDGLGNRGPGCGSTVSVDVLPRGVP